MHNVGEANRNQVGGDHYKTHAIQPWDYIVANGLGYLEGNIVKYVSRWQAKGGKLLMPQLVQKWDEGFVEFAGHVIDVSAE